MFEKSRGKYVIEDTRVQDAFLAGLLTFVLPGGVIGYTGYVYREVLEKRTLPFLATYILPIIVGSFLGLLIFVLISLAGAGMLVNKRNFYATPSYLNNILYQWKRWKALRKKNEGA